MLNAEQLASDHADAACTRAPRVTLGSAPELLGQLRWRDRVHVVKPTAAQRARRPAEVRRQCREHATAQRGQTPSGNDASYASKARHLGRSAQLFRKPLCEYVDNGRCCNAIADPHPPPPTDRGGAARRDPRKSDERLRQLSQQDPPSSLMRTPGCAGSDEGIRDHMANQRMWFLAPTTRAAATPVLSARWDRVSPPWDQGMPRTFGRRPRSIASPRNATSTRQRGDVWAERWKNRRGLAVLIWPPMAICCPPILRASRVVSEAVARHDG